MTLTLIAIQCTIILFIGTTLAIVAIGIRVWSRHIMKVSLAFNDYMAFAAVLLTIGFSVVNFVGKSDSRAKTTWIAYRRGCRNIHWGRRGSCKRHHGDQPLGFGLVYKGVQFALYTKRLVFIADSCSCFQQHSCSGRLRIPA